LLEASAIFCNSSRLASRKIYERRHKSWSEWLPGLMQLSLRSQTYRIFTSSSLKPYWQWQQIHIIADCLEYKWELRLHMYVRWPQIYDRNSGRFSRRRDRSDKEVWGRCKLPQRGLGPSHRPKMDLLLFELSGMHRWQAKTSKWPTAFWSTASHLTHQLHILTLNRVSGQIWDRVRNSGQFSIPNDRIFFSGQAHKIRDCPEKYGMDGNAYVPKQFFLTENRISWNWRNRKIWVSIKMH